jgi:hypothetical protein
VPKLFASPLCPREMVTEDQLATDQAVLALDGAVRGLSRRSLFSSLAAASAAAAVGLVGSTRTAEAQAAAAPSIVDVLNFALNLEYLECNLYLAVSGGGTLTAAEGAGAPITGLPQPLNLDAPTMATAQNLAADERHHIDTLRTAILGLGGTPVNQPPIDYSLGGKMSIQTQAQFLAVARQFTAVGNSAYAGAAQYLVSNPLVLTAAGQILGAEGQHLGGINYLCVLQGVVSPKLDTLDYPPVPVPNPSYFTITPTNAPSGGALGPVRTTSQVLGIVYGVTTAKNTTPPAGVTKGGFFPQGVNGNILST